MLSSGSPQLQPVGAPVLPLASCVPGTQELRGGGLQRPYSSSAFYRDCPVASTEQTASACYPERKPEAQVRYLDSNCTIRQKSSPGLSRVTRETQEPCIPGLHSVRFGALPRREHGALGKGKFSLLPAPILTQSPVTPWPPGPILLSRRVASPRQIAWGEGVSGEAPTSWAIVLFPPGISTE